MFLAGFTIFLFFPLGLLAVAVALRVMLCVTIISSYINVFVISCDAYRHIMTTRQETTGKQREGRD